jgi:hypothetical protein
MLKPARCIEASEEVSVDMGYGPHEMMEWCVVVSHKIYQSLFDTEVIQISVRRYNGEVIHCVFDLDEKIEVRDAN